MFYKLRVVVNVPTKPNVPRVFPSPFLKCKSTEISKILRAPSSVNDRRKQQQKERKTSLIRGKFQSLSEADSASLGIAPRWDSHAFPRTARDLKVGKRVGDSAKPLKETTKNRFINSIRLPVVGFPSVLGWRLLSLTRFPPAPGCLISRRRFSLSAAIRKPIRLHLLRSVFRYRVQFRRSRYLVGDKDGERNLNKANQYSNPPLAPPSANPPRELLEQPPPAQHTARAIVLSFFLSSFPYLFHPRLSAVFHRRFISTVSFIRSPFCRASRSPFSSHPHPHPLPPQASLPPFLGDPIGQMIGLYSPNRVPVPTVRSSRRSNKRKLYRR